MKSAVILSLLVLGVCIIVAADRKYPAYPTNYRRLPYRYEQQLFDHVQHQNHQDRNNRLDSPSGFGQHSPSEQSVRASYKDPATINSQETDFRHIYSLDMSIPSKDCPSTLQLRVGDNLRLCGKKTNGASCDSVTIPTNGQSYSKVLGRVKAYQFGSPDGFNNIQNLDSYYVDGISITYGSPRKHVWTYAASYRQFIPNSPHGSLCPSTGSGTGPWSFVGDNYFCSSGNPGPGWSAKLYSQYPLWSNIQGKCSFCGKNVLSFCVELEASTSDDLELRVCTNERLDNEDIRIETIDFYVAS